MTKNQFWKGSTFFVLFSFDLTLFWAKTFFKTKMCLIFFCTCRVVFPNSLSCQPVKENRTTLQKMSEAMDNDDKAAFKELLASLPLEHVRKIHPSWLKKCPRQKRSVDFNLTLPIFFFVYLGSASLKCCFILLHQVNSSFPSEFHKIYNGSILFDAVRQSKVDFIHILLDFG